MAPTPPDSSSPAGFPVEEPRVLSCSGAELLEIARPLLQQGCSFRIRAPGLSMGRTIRNGDLIEVAPCRPANLRPGTIAFYQRDGRPLAHRFIRRLEDHGNRTFLLRGDTLRSGSEAIPAEDVLGRVTAVWRGGRWRPLPSRVGWCLFGRLAPVLSRAVEGFLRRIRPPVGRLWRALLALSAVRRLLRSVSRPRTWRRATPADRALLLSFYQGRSFGGEEPGVRPLSQGGDIDWSDLFLVEAGRRLVGAVVIFPDEEAPSGLHPWRLYSMKVHWRYRGRGIGELLLRAAVETVRQEGGSSITLDVTETNAPAQALYEKYGFRRTAVRPQPVGPSLFPMELKLDQTGMASPREELPPVPKRREGVSEALGSAQQLTYALLRGAEAHPSGAVEQLAAPFDWDRWLSLVQREGLGGLLGYWCRTGESRVAGLPEAVRAKLTQLYYATASANMRRLRQVAFVIDRLREAGVEVVVLKGAHLAEAVYPSVGCRPMSDVDLLLRPRDFWRANRVLSEVGYEMFDGPEPQASVAVGATLNSSEWRASDPEEAPLHLHWHLRNTSLPYGLVTAVEDDRLWAAAQPFELAGGPALGLAPHHLLLHLADHALVHRYDRLLLLADIAALLRRYGESLDWTALLRDARAFGLSSSLAMSLQLAARYAAAHAPPEVVRALAAVHLTGPERRLVERFERYRRSLLWGWLIYGSRCPTWRTRARYLGLTLLPDRIRLALHSGGPTEWAGYLAYCLRRLTGTLRT